MKAERRHELRENDLLHVLEAARDYVNENGARIGVALVAVIAIAAAVSFGMRSRAASYEDIWRQKSQLSFEDPAAGKQSLAALSSLVTQTSDSSFILSALIEQGRQSLRLAQMVPFPPDADFNHQAKLAFTELRQRYPENPMAIGIASLGLATVEENQYARDRTVTRKETVRQLLESVVKNPKLNGMPFQQMAIERLSHLDATFTDVVYAAPSAPEGMFEVGPPLESADPAQTDPVGGQ